MNIKTKQIEVIQGIELLKAIKEARIKANKPASFLVRALQNLSDYFAAGNLDQCEKIIAEAAANL